MSTLSRLARAWAVRAFGPEHVANLPDRALRVAEEAIELAQALGVPRDKVRLCVDLVYDRPVGDQLQEIGGVLLTSAILCEALGVEPDSALEIELSRVLAKPLADMAARNQVKNDSGLKVESEPFQIYNCNCSACIMIREREAARKENS